MNKQTYKYRGQIQAKLPAHARVTTYNNGNLNKYTTEVTTAKDFGVIDFERYNNGE